MSSVEARPVLDGRKVKFTLEQRRQDGQSMVGVDWLRFTLPLDAVVRHERSALPRDLTWLACLDKSARDVVRETRSADADLDYSSAHCVAEAGARIVCEALGRFEVGVVELRGMDYYTARAAICFAGETVGWVLAGGKSSAQAGTVHVNLFGSAMLHVSSASLARLRDLIVSAKGWITRVDLCFDVFAGHAIQDTRAAYLDGEFDVRGKRPKQEEHGSWTSGHSRTFVVGSRSTGKLLRAYEKGDELFGHEVEDPWVRYEVEFRNNQRVIEPDVLTRPADFFAGAYGFCARLLEEARAEVQAQVIPTRNEVADKTAHSAVERMCRWARDVAGPAVSWIVKHGSDELLSVVADQAWRVPRRLRGFSEAQLLDGFEKVARAFAPAGAPSFNGA